VEAGDPLACFTLGSWYYHGKGGLPVDKLKAFELHAKAAELNYPPSMFNLAMALLTGDGLPVDHTEAEKWLRKAHDKGFPEASLNLAKMYVDGYGVKRNYDEAKAILRPILEKNQVAKELYQEIENREYGNGSNTLLESNKTP
jgi:TPR repeat protein